MISQKPKKVFRPSNLNQLKKNLKKGDSIWYYHFGNKRLEKRIIQNVGSKHLDSKTTSGEDRFGELTNAKNWQFTDKAALHSGDTIMTAFGYFYQKPTEEDLKEGLQALTGLKPKRKAQLELSLNGKKKAQKVGPNGPLEDALDKVQQFNQKVETGKKIVDQVKKVPGVLSIADMLSMKFEKLKFTDKWADFMQNVPPNLRLLVYGQGKNGKTSLSFQLAKYLTSFGPVLYNLADQGISATTQDLILSTGLKDVKDFYLSGGRTIEELREAIQAIKPQFVFIDLMNNYDIDARSFEAFMKQEFPETGFILVMEATKGEDFRGEGTWLNIVDAKVFCKDFVAYNNGRLGFGEFDIWPERTKQEKSE